MEEARVLVIGAGPAGLMAAEVLSRAGKAVTVADRMPDAGRKFLRAGVGGLNLTHSGSLEQFLARYVSCRPVVEPWLRGFGPEQLQAWVQELGVSTFVGTSGRVFPVGMQAKPLLEAWLARLQQAGVRFLFGWDWQGRTAGGRAEFLVQGEHRVLEAEAVLLALGGASWPQLGSNGAWLPVLQAAGLTCTAFEPANCGFEADWSPEFQSAWARQPLKNVGLSLVCASGLDFWPPRPAVPRSDLMITAWGLEGSPVYTLAEPLRKTLNLQGTARLEIDLLPDKTARQLEEILLHPAGKKSWSSLLKSRLGLDGLKLALVKERTTLDEYRSPSLLAGRLKALPVEVVRPRPLAEAISSAGGLTLDQVDSRLMLRRWPGWFAAGEMLDWEAPTGGYLLTACLAGGRFAARGILDWLERPLSGK